MTAAKEFNVGKETLVDFLAGKGFNKDDLKPTAKLTEEMYRALQAEFQSDKVAKLKSEQIDLPKGAAAESKRKRDEEEITFRKEEKKVVRKEEPVPAPVVAEVPAPPVAPEPKVAEPIKEEQPEIVKLEAPEIEGPKVLDKIDLSTIDSSTRPKKATKKTKAKASEKAAEDEVAPEPEVAPEKVEETKLPVMKAEPEVEETPKEETPVIENIQAEKIEGPRILGKIELPVDNDTRPKIDEKRKRKRIPIEKKDAGPQGFNGEASKAAVSKVGFKAGLLVALPFSQERPAVVVREARAEEVVLLRNVDAPRVGAVLDKAVVEGLHQGKTSRLTKKKFNAESRKHRQNFPVERAKERT